MASSLSQVEDQTDEDFFDKLVDDEFEITESVGIKSENAKAFSNLSIKDVDTILEDSGSGIPLLDAPEKDILVAEESISLVSSMDSTTGRDVASDTASSKSAGSRCTSVKEVQWSLFNADSDQKVAEEFGSYSDLFPELPNSSLDQFEASGSDTKASTIGNTVTDLTTSINSSDYQEGQTYEAVSSKTMEGQDLYNIQYWENLYPGWKYDPNTGEWHQLDGQGATENAQLGFQENDQSVGEGVISEQRSEASYLQQTAQTIVGTVSEGCVTRSVSNLNEVSQDNIVYPPNMVFDPQYPGWYYDTDTQEWRLLETYNQTVQTTSIAHDQQSKGDNAPLADISSSGYGGFGQFENYNSQNQGDRDRTADWAGSAINYSHQNALQSGLVAKREDVSRLPGSQQTGDPHGSMGHVKNYADQQMCFSTMKTVASYGQADSGYNSKNDAAGIQSFVSLENPYQFNQPKVEQHQQTSFSHSHYGSQNLIDYSQQSFRTGNSSYSQFSHVPNGGRSSAGRPPHALVTFGFGGKLVVMKDSNLFSKNAAYESQDSVGHSISILNLMEVVMEKIDSTDSSCIASAAFEYFRTLCIQSFPGPLVGGNAAMKELNKWIDEKITNCESPNLDFRKGELLRLLLSLLKISCQQYGKLRSPFGVDPTIQETDGPESAVTKLFASARRNGAQMNDYGPFTHCMKNLPSEGHLQATAVEVQNLLVSGRRKEALQCAQEGQLWGPALVLAAQLGEKFYVDTVKQMAHYQFVSGSPLRTLCLLIAGQPADVFSPDSSINCNLSDAVISQRPMQVQANAMLDDWETNLAIITANRTKDDELVIVHLGDCLWKERSEIIAAHTCYLVAEANFESYSETARMCLLGADHWKCPRTYASPEAIQRTEFYEYSKVLGNSQFILLPFQPYKLIYAYMLAEVGRVSDSLKYCQAILKSLKNSGRASDVESWKLLISSLEERIRTHQQGGYGANLVPTKLVGKLFTSIDRSIHRMIGTPPLPPSSTSQNSVQNSEVNSFSMVPKVASSQSTMAMSSLMPSASMEPISDWAGDGNRMTRHNRSISEPDFGRSPIQMDPSKESTSADRGNSSISGGSTRFGRLGSQLLQKTMGWVSRSRPDRQAKLGETNKFYYDDKLKRWVEEGVEPPVQEAALPPPPTTASFQNGMSDHYVNNAFQSQNSSTNGGAETKNLIHADHQSSGIPPIPPSTNQFSARSRAGVRSRYVDTFNKKGGTPTNLFQSPTVPAAKAGGGAKFFIPTPTATVEQKVDATEGGVPEIGINEDHPSPFFTKELPFSSPSSSSVQTIQRFPSMNNIAVVGNPGMGALQNGNGARPYHARAASWGPDMYNSSEIKTLGETLGMMPPSSFMPTDHSSVRPNSNGGSFGDLHEVEL